ncbi:UNVERIFIED_CONTAM: hypothetical protein RMT77_008164 [Armadillidium vulgare]
MYFLLRFTFYLIQFVIFINGNERIRFPEGTYPTGEAQATTEELAESEVGTPQYEGGVKPPKFREDWICGYATKFSLIHFGNMKKLNGEFSLHQLYYLNETAEKLKADGFNVEVNRVGYGDVLCNFTFSNETYEDTFAYDYIGSISAFPEETNKVTRSYYMALIGERNGSEVKWMCDGALINHRWILSSAHCFTKPGITPNVVRLGDFNLNDQSDLHQTASNKFIREYSIHSLVFYPDFKDTEGYHDLALIQIPRAIPLRGHNFFPICLPWGEETDRDLVGEGVTLTGWGRTVKDDVKSHQLQEANITVFDNSVCDKDVGSINGNITHAQHSQPLEDTFLCAGSTNDSNQGSCAGDSGSPIVYLKEELDKSKLKSIKINLGKSCDTDQEGPKVGLSAQSIKYVLAGILSRNFKCGMDRPGIYIPINKPIYLEWIKNVAFNEYV